MEIPANEFIKMYSKSLGGAGKPSYIRKYNFEGVYIIHNKTKNKYYIGQSIRVFDRVRHHFDGNGNCGVFVDYRRGGSFTIKMISLKNSGFDNLNDLERYAIRKYNAYYKGYNMTRGNR